MDTSVVDVANQLSMTLAVPIGVLCHLPGRNDGDALGLAVGLWRERHRSGMLLFECVTIGVKAAVLLESGSDLQLPC